MAARFCSYCGKPVPPAAAFCPSCGAAVVGASGTPPSGVAPSRLPGSVPYGYAPSSSPPAPVADTRPVDLAALSAVAIAAALALVGVLLGLTLSALINVAGLISVTQSPSGLTISLPPAWVWVVLLVVIGGFDLAELFLLRSAFQDLSYSDTRFSTPASLALVAFVGLTLALVGVATLLDALYAAVTCAGSGMPIPSSCLLTNTFWVGVALVGVGGLIALVGYIGVLLGIWRLGTRYQATAFKVGAILLIIPYLNVIGAILILVAARAARSRIRGVGSGTFAPG